MPHRAYAVVRAGEGRSDVHRARGAGPLRLLTPRAAGDAAWIVTSSLGGGLVDGDDVELDVTVDAGATCVVTTQASTKAYRGRVHQELRIGVGERGRAIVVPDHLVPFADARVRQATRISLAPSASLVLCDVLTAGRVAHGETWACERVDTTLAIARSGVTRLLDRVVLDRAHGSIAARMRGLTAIATCVLVGPDVAAHAKAALAAVAARPLREAGIVVAASPLDDDGAIVRIAGAVIDEVIAATRVQLADACSSLGESPWARKW